MTPITRGGTDRGYKLCKCARCGVERECTPTQDFYTYGDDVTGPLYCGHCLWMVHIEYQKATERAEEQAIQNRIKEMRK